MRRTKALIALTLILLLPAAASAASPKLSDRLQREAGPQSAARPAPGAPRPAEGVVSRYGDAFVTEIRTRGTATGLVSRLRDAGARVLHVSDRYDTVTAAVDRTDLEAVAGVRGVAAVTEVLRPETGQIETDDEGGSARRVGCADRITTEGDAQLRAAIARSTYGVDGTGVTVGVLSDSYDRAKDRPDPPGPPVTTPAQDIASGDLPGAGNPCGFTTPVQVLQDDRPPVAPEVVGDADEGRAMLQIVHDVAPGASLKFATAFISETSFADNIIALENAGAKVIVDDVIYAQEPFYQDGPIANAVSQVTDAGVAYFSMAFNNGQRLANVDVGSWEAPAFRSVTCPAAVAAAAGFPAGSTCMDFDPAGGTDSAFDIGVGASGKLNVDLQWAEPIGAVGTDYDLWVLFDNTVVPNVYSLDTNPPAGRPFEFAGIQGGDTTVKRQVVISRRPGGASPRLKFVIQNNGTPITSFEYPAGGGTDTVGPTIYGHNGTAKAQTVGAISYLSTTAPEAFSGRGPVTHYFGPVGASPAAVLGTPEVLGKPDITATDRGANTFFGALVAGAYRFSGTSAAAPHAAGVAALQLQVNGGLTQPALKANQQTSGRPIGAFGPLAVGSGLLDAVGAIQADPLLGPVGGPPALGNNRQPATTFAATRAATFTCAVDDGAAAACTSPFIPGAPLADGPHAVTVTAKDAAGLTATSSPLAFTIDATGPVAAISSGPDGLTKLRRPAFAFAPGEAGATARCSFDGGAFAPCASPAAPSVELPDGKHLFAVTGVDGLGNQGTPASSAFTVDATKPVLTFKSKPKKKVSKRKATFKVKTSEKLAKLECKLDKKSFKTCKATRKLRVRRGKHAFSVRGTDAAGNVSKAVTYKWRVRTR